jgi:hypothetical protein
MRKEAVDKNFGSALEAYWTRPVFQSLLRDVRKDFLEATGLSTLAGVPFVVACLLLASTMDRLAAGYSGSSTRDDSLLYEAIGIGGFYWGGNPRHPQGTRYGSLVYAVSSAQSANKDFRAFCDSFIAEVFQDIKP